MAMEYPFRNLTFEDGGAKSLAYLGAFEVLEEHAILADIKRIGATSAGAPAALLFGLNYTQAEMKEILGSMDSSTVFDDATGLTADVNRLSREFGWFKGDHFRSYAANLIKNKTGNSESTFKEIHDMRISRGFKDIYLASTNLATGFSELFSVEHTPRLPVADAVRLSMSIPLLFAAKQNIRGDFYVDGSLVNNDIVKVFDRTKYIDPELLDVHSRPADYYEQQNAYIKAMGKELSPYVYNMQTLGFRLSADKNHAGFRDQAEHPATRVDSFFTYTLSLIEHVIENQSFGHLHIDDWHRTIFINTMNVRTMQYGLDERTREDLIRAGREYSDRYFKWYDDREYFPWNTDKLTGPINRPEE